MDEKKKMTEKICSVLTKNQTILAQKIMDKHYEKNLDMKINYSNKEKKAALEDTEFHLKYLIEALRFEESKLFRYYISWVKELFIGLNLNIEGLKENLQIMQSVIRETFPKYYETINEYLNEGIRETEQKIVLTQTYITENQPYAELTQEYVNALLERDKQKALKLILGEIDKGTAIKDLYLHVFQLSQWEIGRLWQNNEISVAQEHYCTSATQLIMGQLYQHLISSERKNKILIATCVGKELHELGIRMVSNLFELDGWDTYYLGANMPSGEIITIIKDIQPDLIALSTTIVYHLSEMKNLVSTIKQDYTTTKVVVGGYPFNLIKNLWKKIGADGYAPDAEKAVKLGNELVG